MCLSYPALVLSVDRDGAVVRGAKRDFRALTTVMPEVAPGDYVLVAGGLVLERLDPADAHEIRQLFERATLDRPIGREAAAGGIAREAG
jgi:hydrogenase maturation factor